MANLQLVAYFNQNKGKYSVDQLKQTLIKQGYSASDVNDAARAAQSSSPAMPLPPSSLGMDPNSFFNFDQQTKETITDRKSVV